MDKYISLADTDLKICRIGLGTADAGIRWDGKDAQRVFDTYLDVGGNTIDTARVYSDWIPPEIGRSERVIGDWLQSSGKRDQIILMTKGGHPSLTGDFSVPRMTAADMRYDLELSLKALHTDRIDIYFYHRDNRLQSIEEEIETMENFRREGKIRYYGCSNWDAQRIKEADLYCKQKGYRGFVADQALYNWGLANMKPLPDNTQQSIKGELYQYHAETSHNLAMPFMGVAGGFFHMYAAAGHEAVKNSPYYTPANIRLAEKCIALTKKYNATVTQVVLGFFANQPFACAPLYGPMEASHLIDAMHTLEIPFEPEDFIME